MNERSDFVVPDITTRKNLGLTHDAADYTLPQPLERYSAADHATWATLYQRQCAMLPGRACDEFMQGLQQLEVDADRVPDFAVLNQKLLATTGWQTAQRFKLTDQQGMPCPHPYLAFYEVEADDPKSVGVMDWWAAMFQDKLTTETMLTDDPIKLVAPRSDDDDGNLRFGSDLATHIEPVNVGKAQVEQHEVVALGDEGVLPGSDVNDLKTGVSEAPADDLCDRRIVFHQQDPHGIIVADKRAHHLDLGVWPRNLGRFLDFLSPSSGSRIPKLMCMKAGLATSLSIVGVLATGGNDAAAKVANGEAEIAVVLISEIGEAKGAKLAAPLPGPTQLWMDYSAAIPASSTDPANAKALVSALTSPTMRPRWVEAGWEPAK